MRDKVFVIVSKNFEINKKQIDDEMSKINEKLNRPITSENEKDCKNELEKLKLKKKKIIAEYASKSQEEIKES